MGSLATLTFPFLFARKFELCQRAVEEEEEEDEKCAKVAHTNDQRICRRPPPTKEEEESRCHPSLRPSVRPSYTYVHSPSAAQKEIQKFLSTCVFQKNFCFKVLNVRISSSTDTTRIAHFFAKCLCNLRADAFESVYIRMHVDTTTKAV